MQYHQHSSHIILRAAPSELKRTFLKSFPAVTDEVWLRGTMKKMSGELRESRRVNYVTAAFVLVTAAFVYTFTFCTNYD